MMIAPRRSVTQASEIRQCDWELETWQNQLPTKIKFFPVAPSELDEVQKVIHLHRALLQMIYLAASSALHRPEVLHRDATQPEMWELSRSRVRSAASAISNISLDLQMLEIICCLPATGVTVFFAAGVSHLYDMTFNDPNTQSVGFMFLDQCIHALEILGETYNSASLARNFLQMAMEKVGSQSSTRH